MSVARNGALTQLDPSLRRKLPGSPDEFNPVPPFATSKTPVIFVAGTLKLPLKLPAKFRLPGICTVSALLPKTSVLLVLTTVPEPKAEANVRLLTPTFAFLPISVLFAPVVLVCPVKAPTKTLAAPVVVNCPAPCPKYELRLAVVLPSPAPSPKKEFESPVELFAPAVEPKKELRSPVVVPTPENWPKKEFL